MAKRIVLTLGSLMLILSLAVINLIAPYAVLGASDPSVSIDPATQTKFPGETVTIDVMVDATGYTLKGCEVTVQFDDSVMSPTTTTGHNLIGGLEIGPTTAGNTVNYAMAHMGGGTADVNGSVLTIDFLIDGGATPDDYDFTLITFELRNEQNAELQVNVANGSVTIGCPDADQDGICDADDPCPNDPDNDEDGDGVCVPEDLCPTQGDEGFGVNQDGCPNSCPDGDNDGVCDADDQCPNEGDLGCGVDPVGCPLDCPVETSFSIVAQPQNVCPGDTVTVDVMVDATGLSIKGCEATVKFDDSVMSTTLGQITGHNLLGGLDIGPIIEDGNKVTYALAATTAQPDVAGSMMTIEFTIDGAASPGTYDFEIIEAELRDQDNNTIPISTITNGSLTIDDCPCPDGDNDGVCDADDCCPNEGDQGYGVDQDGCPNPCPDSDQDGICDDVDNCVDTYNPNQTDSDGDGIGDACERYGSITVVKDINIGAIADGAFQFTTDLLGSFSIPYGGGTYEMVWTNLDPGDYTFTEATPPVDWTLTSVVCTGGDCTDVANGVIVNLDAGEDVTVTFTNEYDDPGVPPIPEMPTIILLSLGLLTIGGFIWHIKRRRLATEY